MTQPTPQDPAAAAKANTVRLREDLIHPDPLLDCLVELCRLHGQAATRASLSAALPLRDGRLTIELAERAAARAGMTTRLQRLALDALDTAALPAVLVLKDNRACVLLGFDADSGQVLHVLREVRARADDADLRSLVGVLVEELGRWFVAHAQMMDAALAQLMVERGYDPETGRLLNPRAPEHQPITGCGGSSCS